jgi:hypothetical protein
MRVAHLVIVLVAFAAAACGGKPGKSICDNQVPPPAACMSECDPAPGAANTCPSGFHCAADGFCDALCTPSGNECGDGYVCTADGRCKGENECTGLECNVAKCTQQGKPDTTVSGTVFAPNGTLPLYGVKVYVPNAPVPPFTEGAECARCTTDDQLPGSPVYGVAATTDEAGKFVLPQVPKGQNIPLVIASGKWRRQITIPNVAECADTAVPAADTRLPKNKSEGDIPRIALTTGNADTIECLLRRMGIDDAEIGKQGDDKRVHLFRGNGVGEFQGGFPGGSGTFPSADPWWRNVDNLKTYDIVILSCEGNQNAGTKGQDGLNAMKSYADLGGRVFASHWHNVWIGGNFTGGGQPSVAQWLPVATWGSITDPPNGSMNIIDENSNPKGSAFATWMLNVMGSTVRGQIPLQNDTIKSTAATVDTGRAERWTYLQATGTGNGRPQNFQFTTPIEAAADQKCGKVVFSDMHVAGNAQAGTYPAVSCGDATPRALTPQEKALAFMLFDLATCVSVIL